MNEGGGQWLTVAVVVTLLAAAGARLVRSNTFQRYPASYVRVYAVWFDTAGGRSRAGPVFL